jgi:acyl phosphate:glycerol-3-phosphate acyltransferase
LYVLMHFCHWLAWTQDWEFSSRDLDIPIPDVAPAHIGLHELMLLALLAFFAGSVPFGLWISKAMGVDIRKHGSGNIGATNVARVLGPRLGFLCFALDMFKGFLPVFYAGLYLDIVPGLLFARPIYPAQHAWVWMTIMALPILGHMYSPWVGFKGGKGVATGLGALLGVFPYLTLPALAAAVIWGTVVYLSRFVSLASVAATASLPVLVMLWAWISVSATEVGPARTQLSMALRLQGPGLIPFYVITGIMAAFVVWKHRSNIVRLISGKERRIGERVQASPSAPQA